MKDFKNLQFHHAQRGAVFLILSLLVAGLLGPSLPAIAHGVLASYVQHGVLLKVGAEHIDLTVDLTFFEEPSARERKVMDADADGHITRSEVEGYLKKLAPGFLKHVKLFAAGREVPLIPLYDPEIELATAEATALAHHRLRLCFFAITPPSLKANDVFLVEDQFWPEVKSLGAQQADGDDGCRLQPEVQVQKNAPGEWSRESRQFRFRCLKPPTPKATSGAWRRSESSQNQPSIP